MLIFYFPSNLPVTVLCHLLNAVFALVEQLVVGSFFGNYLSKEVLDLKSANKAILIIRLSLK